MLVNRLKTFLFLLVIAGLSACSGEAPQVSGVVAIANYETVACVPQQKTLQIRNNDTSEPQRVQGVLFEMGTNDFDKDGIRPEAMKEGETYLQYFKVDEVAVGNTVKQAVGNMVQEIIIPPGGIMTVKVSYNPRAVTSGEQYHNTYLDVVLNGPKLGVMQIELRGKAPTAQEGCGTTQGDLQVFTVTKVKIQIQDSDEPSLVPQEPTGITEPLQFAVQDGKALISKQDFPEISIETPDSTVQADLIDQTFEGTFDGSKLDFPSVSLAVAGGAITVEGKLTTDAIEVTGADGTLSVTGSPLADGKMKLVFGAILPDNPLLQTLQGGVITAEIELEKQGS